MIQLDGPGAALEVRSARTMVSLRAYTPFAHAGSRTYTGAVMHRPVALYIRDYILWTRSSLRLEYPSHLPAFPTHWWIVLHYNELSGQGFGNTDASISAWGPGRLTLAHGEAEVTWGGPPLYIRADENDYTNYPPWRCPL